MLKTTFTNSTQDKDFMATIVTALSGSSITHPSSPNIQINEKLDYDDAEEVSYWDSERPHHTEHAINNVFGDKSRIEFPLNGGEDVPHPDVEDHLNKHGYAITDYAGGKAKDKYNREVNIGKALTKTQATPDIKAAYDNDPTRQQQKKGLKVVISHRPVDVAGMTSGHQSWVNQSCMNFKTGGYRQHLQDDVREGTHVAYLTNHDDHDLDHPVARIAAKPFHSDSGHTIFRPESRTFGDANSAFHKTVSDWFEHHYPAEPDETYTKNEHVYDDDGDSTYHAMTKETADYHINNKVKIEKAVPSHIVNHIAHRVINDQLANPTGSSMNDFTHTIGHVAFNRNQVNAIYKVAREHGQTSLTHTLAVRAGDTLNKANLAHAIANHSGSHSVLAHKYLPSEFVDTLPVDRLSGLHPNNIKPHHVDRVVDHYLAGGSGSWYSLSDMKDRLNKDHLMKLTNKKSLDSMVGFIGNHPKADKDVHAALFNNIKAFPDSVEKKNALVIFNNANPNPTHEHVAASNDASSLSAIMNNAKDKFTHNLAFQKSMSLSKEPPAPNKPKHLVMLSANSNQHLSDDDIKDIYDNLKNVGTVTMPNDIHDRVLKHSMKEIDAAHAKLHPKDMFDEDPADYAHSPEYKAVYDHMQNHFDKHAELIDDKVSDMRSDFRNENEIDHKYFEQLGNHIDAAKDHPGHEGSHDDVGSEHMELESDIESRRDRW